MTSERNLKMTKTSKVLLFSSLGVLLASPTYAQTVPEHSVFVFNSLLFLIGGFLLFFVNEDKGKEEAKYLDEV